MLSVVGKSDPIRTGVVAFQSYERPQTIACLSPAGNCLRGKSLHTECHELLVNVFRSTHYLEIKNYHGAPERCVFTLRGRKFSSHGGLPARQSTTLGDLVTPFEVVVKCSVTMNCHHQGLHERYGTTRCTFCTRTSMWSRHWLSQHCHQPFVMTAAASMETFVASRPSECVLGWMLFILTTRYPLPARVT